MGNFYQPQQQQNYRFILTQNANVVSSQVIGMVMLLHVAQLVTQATGQINRYYYFRRVKMLDNCIEHITFRTLVLCGLL